MFGRIQIFGNRHANGRTNSHFLHHLHGDFTTPVHIREKDRSGLNHFKHGKARSDFDILSSELSLERPNVFLQPLLKRHIVGIASQQSHCSMRVSVVKRRDNGQAIAFNDFGICIITLGKFATDLGKLFARNQNILFFSLEQYRLKNRFSHKSSHHFCIKVEKAPRTRSLSSKILLNIRGASAQLQRDG